MRGLVLTLIGVLALAAQSAAAKDGTREEAIAMVKRVQATYAARGPQATFNAITNTSEFRNRDLYPFVFDVDGWSVAHGANPQMVGKLWISTKDQDGNYLIKEMVAITRGPGSNPRLIAARKSPSIGLPTLCTVVKPAISVT